MPAHVWRTSKVLAGGQPAGSHTQAVLAACGAARSWGLSQAGLLQHSEQNLGKCVPWEESRLGCGRQIGQTREHRMLHHIATALACLRSCRTWMRPSDR
jgi:hypothetical protein